MATNRYKSGEVWDYTAGATISSGDAVEIAADELVGIALDDIANGSVGPVATTGVFSVTKAAGTAWTIGMDIYYDGTEFVTTATSNTWAGKAFLAAASGAVAGYLDLNKGAGLVSTGDIADESVTTAKMADLARGSLLSGQGSNRPLALAAETSGQVLVGDGTDIASVAVSGDVTMASTGAVTIAALAVETGMIAADAVDATKIADDAVSAEHLDDGILPSHVCKYAGEFIWSGGGTSLAATVTGALATDIVTGCIQTVPSEAGYLASLAVTNDTVTATLSAANTSNDAYIAYQVMRAVV